MHKAILFGAAMTAIAFGALPAAAYVHGSLAATQPLRIATNGVADLRSTESLPSLTSLTVKSADGLAVGTV